jgi:glycolate oxidase FAD binding subunit
MARSVSPEAFEDVAATLAAAAAEGHSVRIRGAGTKLHWGLAAREPEVELQMTGLNELVEHNSGDLTAVLQAGARLDDAQRTFAEAGQMLALDPPSDGGATIGGVIATADSGPLRHRYGAPRDLLLGMTVALSDGTIARSGGKVIKNVAGYDIAKLFAGSFGTLGAILSVNLRLHPQPVATATALGATTDPTVIATAAKALAAAPLELEALDVAWRGGRGGLLAMAGGAEAGRRAERVGTVMREAGLEKVDVVEDDSSLWSRQRAGQRSREGAVVRVAARPSALADVVRAAESCGGTVVGRAALGWSYVEVEPASVASLRETLPPGAVTVVLDAPAESRSELDPWGVAETPAIELMRRVKARFDPSGACNPGVFVGGI